MARLRWLQNARTGDAGTEILKPIRMGTSYATALTTATASIKWLSFYTKSTATSGDGRGIYNRYYIAGTGGGGESLRSYTEITGVVAGTAHGAHLSLGMGESTTGGAVTGLGVATRSTLGLPNVALASGGTYAALMPEIYSFGSSSDAGAVTELSFIRCVNGGDATGMATVDDDAYLMSIQGCAAATGQLFQTGNALPPTVGGSLKIKIGSTEYFLILYTSEATTN